MLLLLFARQTKSQRTHLLFCQYESINRSLSNVRVYALCSLSQISMGYSDLNAVLVNLLGYT